MAERAAWLDENFPGNCIPTATENLTSENNVFIAPNPCYASTTIQLRRENNRMKQLILFNGHGEIVRELSFAGSTIYLQCQELLPGIYFIQIKDKDEMLWGKLAVMK